MKCIDAIEGTVKSILDHLHRVAVEDRLDDAEYIRNIKAVIEATDDYILDNPELVDEPETLQQVLYAYSRNLWLKAQNGADQDQEFLGEPSFSSEAEEYQAYYFDQLYHKGIYPR